ncbi:iron-sulfur cluster assembly scaffold protein [Petroclostridium sp. X23]|uniref:iron-sulfur cluster assembly scaffold protein n=1 Tax=Petroclostridium sp. X23 TaxID=3045146 RepID=UPI0024ADDC90|nr:iron-sulfur cluster assembly scaffold protein [Petroclostridium sp. X23]WHH59507.1 iron-sulfur cluster assembly scaffold protein [Petroclostridium sp. X23]
MYSDIAIDHFMCPRNIGNMLDANGQGECGDPSCGDYLIIYIRVENHVIEDISFMVFGCAGAIATSSMTTVLTKGKTIEAALKLTEEDVIEALGGLPEDKQHCSNLGVQALKKAIEDYYRRNKIEK